MTNTEIKQFFEGWEIYRGVIAQDYMLHDEIVTTLRPAHPHNGDRPRSVLELGCGDAYVASQIFPHDEPLHYTGVDLAQPALDLAEKRLSGTGWDITLTGGDMLDCIRDMTPGVDIIISGYALHHLDSAQKQGIMQQARRCLAGGGVFTVYDFMMAATENRQDFIDRYLAHVDADWNCFSAQQKQDIENHIRTQDHPVSGPDWQDMAQKAGFRDCTQLYRDDNGFYSILQFS